MSSNASGNCENEVRDWTIEINTLAVLELEFCVA